MRSIIRNQVKKFALLFSLFMLAGCASHVDSTVTTFKIKTTKSSNNGTPFYVLIKCTDFTHFLTDDYQKVATQSFITCEDPSCLSSTCFIPGMTKTIQVKTPENKSAAIYFLFTHPGEDWKHIIDHQGPHKVKILLGENEIKSINKF